MPAATAAMPSSASPRPAPSSASRSGTTSAPGSSSPATQPSPTSRNSSLSVAQQPNPPGLLPLLPTFALSGYFFCETVSGGRAHRNPPDGTLSSLHAADPHPRRAGTQPQEHRCRPAARQP